MKKNIKFNFYNTKISKISNMENLLISTYIKQTNCCVAI